MSKYNKLAKNILYDFTWNEGVNVELLFNDLDDEGLIPEKFNSEKLRRAVTFELKKIIDSERFQKSLKKYCKAENLK